MLRPAIVVNIKKYPNADHILHINNSTAPMFFDIENLMVVSIEGKSIGLKQRNSRKLLDSYKEHQLYELSRPCAQYEAETVPYIIQSRQDLFCEVVDVKFNIGNYNVSFTEEEMGFAEDFLSGKEVCIGVHLRSAEQWRDFRYINIKKNELRMVVIAEELARRIDGYVILFDMDYEYNGKAKNIVSLVESNVRNVWAVMSRMLFGVGPDSAGVHMFGSTGVPVYGVFGPTDPGIRLKYHNAYWPPRYSKCNMQYCWYHWPRCKYNIGCLNYRTSRFFAKDIMRKVGRFLI